MEGQTVSHYRILKKIGEGGMGEVFLAEDTSLDRKVALKFLPDYLDADDVAHKRFLREAKSAAALDHPYICHIHEVGEVEGQNFIAMEYVRGQTLKEKLSAGRMPLKEALQIGVEIAEALERAHNEGIVHRDLKPANIMLTEEGHAKVMDFGLAKRLSTTGDEDGEITEGLTREGTTLGTLNYMSPEQLRGEPVDTRADIFSFGVLLYEMLTGVHPFRKQTRMDTVSALLTTPPQPPDRLQPDLPADLKRIMTRALEKEPEKRYSSAAQMQKELKKCEEELHISETGVFNLRLLLRRLRQPRVGIPALILLAAIGFLSYWFLNRQAKINWARGELLPQIDQLIEDGWVNYIAAFNVAVEAERYLPNDPQLAEFFKKIATHISIRTEPPSAAIFIQKYAAPESEWEYLGVSPIERIRLPLGLFRWKMEKEGYETVFAAAPTFDGWLVAHWSPHDIVRTLDKEESLPAGMVRVKGGGEIGDFFIDRYEVTNRQFKEFVDKGGYQKQEYWKERFTNDGVELTREKARNEFLDRTGQPGPATWVAGDYPAGQADYPVSGVSWYEAAAYAEFKGRNLPTASHWGIARGEFTPLIRGPGGGNSMLGSFVASLSNFQGSGSVSVGSSGGMTSYGAYDMAGNVREWCWNESPKGRLIRGAAWNDATYLFQDFSQASPFDRSPQNGFRCALYLDPDKIPQSVLEMKGVLAAPDFHSLKPVSDPVFQAYKEQFSYDKTDLNARIEWRDDGSTDWVQEKITFDAAYESERIIAYLFLPRKSPPPHQTVVYFPGAGPLVNMTSSKDLDQFGEFDFHLSFIVKNGRAVLFPIYKGTFERGPVVRSQMSSRDWVELYNRVFKDFGRSIDYLETRPVIDSRRLAYLGFSWGAQNGAIIPAIESRLKASVLGVGGLDYGFPPQNDPINYVTRVRIPTLMLNGIYDVHYPYETSSKPMFDLLGTPKDQKVQKLYDTGHFIPRDQLIKETLNWLDRYLGPVESGL